MNKFNLYNLFKKKNYSKLKFNKFIYRDCKFSNVTFDRCTFDKSEFWKVSLDNVIFKKCTFNQTIFSDIQFKKCKFIECKINNSSFSHLIIERKIFFDCNFYKNKFNTVILNSKDILPRKVFNNNRELLITKTEKNNLVKNIDDKGFDFKKNNNKYLDNNMFYINHRHFIEKMPKKFSKTNLSFKIKKKKFNINRIVYELVFGNGFVELPENSNTKHLLNSLRILNKNVKSLKKFTTNKRDKQTYLDNLFSQSISFSKILPKQKYFEPIKEVLGQNFTCGFYSANILAPGARGQPFHIDYPYPTMDKKNGKLKNFSFKNPINIQLQIMLANLNKKNGVGPTDVVPGTQYLQQDPKALELYENTKSKEVYFSIEGKKHRYKIESLVGKKGKIIIFNGLLWHRAGDNLSENENRITLNMQLLSNHVRPYNKFKGIKKSKNNFFNQLTGYNLKYPQEV